MVLPCNPGGIRPFPDSLDMFFGILGAMYMNNGQLTPLAAGRSIGFRNGPSAVQPPLYCLIGGFGPTALEGCPHANEVRSPRFT